MNQAWQARTKRGLYAVLCFLAGAGSAGMRHAGPQLSGVSGSDEHVHVGGGALPELLYYYVLVTLLIIALSVKGTNMTVNSFKLLGCSTYL